MCPTWQNIVTNLNQLEPLNSILSVQQKRQLLIRLYLIHYDKCERCKNAKYQTPNTDAA